MPETSDLLIRIDATTALLQQQLAQAERATKRASGSMARSLKQIDDASERLVAGMSSVNDASLRMVSGMSAAGAAAAGLSVRAGAMGKSTGLAGAQMLQLSQQFQDFGIQVAGGQNPLIALAQQGSQVSFIMGGFGATLVAVREGMKALTAAMLTNPLFQTAGIASVVAGAAASVLLFSDNTDEAAEAQDRLNKILETGADRYKQVRRQSGLTADARAAEARNIVAMGQIEITRLETQIAAEELRLRRLGARGAVAQDDPFRKEKDALRQMRLDLIVTRAQLGQFDSGMAHLFDTGDPANDDGKTKTKATKEQTSALDDLVSSMRDENTLLGLNGEERAKTAALLRAQAAAQRDYDNLLRDSPLLTLEEKAAIEATAAAHYNLEQSIKAADKANKQAAKEAERAERQWKRFGVSLSEDVGKDLADVALGFEDLGDVVVSTLRQILNQALKMQSVSGGGGIVGGIVSSLINGLSGFSGANPGNALTGFANPAFPGKTGRASGGPVVPGMLYEVGERGREIFAPSVPGTIIPNHALGRMGGMTKIINIDARGAAPGVEHNIMRAIRASEDRAVTRSIASVRSLQNRTGGARI